MIIRSKAPLRIGFAGGGTDVSPFSDDFGGAVLNATISMYAYAVIEPRNDGRIMIRSQDQGVIFEAEKSEFLEIDGELDLLKGVYNRLVREFIKKPVSFRLTTYVDAPAGSGLGSSSTLVVATIGAFAEWLKIPLGEYDIARLAYEIERFDLGLAGGKQDQYAATFGGFNFIEFFGNEKVIVNPLRIKTDLINELEFNIVLYYTGISRVSSQIVELQSRNVTDRKKIPMESMHRLKIQAVQMKEAILKGELGRIGEILDFGWGHKKKTAINVTNRFIDKVYEAAKESGATGGKISGAGGGGFMMLYCPGNSRYAVIESLKQFGGEFRRYQYTPHGLLTWKGLK